MSAQRLLKVAWRCAPVTVAGLAAALRRATLTRAALARWRSHAPLLRGLVSAVVTLGTMGLGSSPAAAITTTLNFDGLAHGTIVNTLSGATFQGDPTVFTPQHVPTQSPPHALHTPSPCPSTTSINDACGRQTVTFASPVSVVSLRLGLDDEAAENEIPTVAQLKAYNASGVVVADTGDVMIGDSNYFPITKLMRVQSAHTDITRVVLMVGTTEIYPGASSRRVNLDDFTFTDDTQAPVPAPTARIDAPTSGTTYNRVGDVRVSGQVSAPAGVTKFCLSIQSTIPATCNDAAVLDGSGNFRELGVSGLRPGINRVFVWVQDAQARVAFASIDITLPAFDLRPANMEVTQAVQSALPDVWPANFVGLHTATYSGVPLAASKATFVRVWTDARFTNGPTTVPDVRMILTGTRNGASLGGPLTPVNGMRSLVPGDVTGSAVRDAVRSNPTSAYIFQLPPGWTHGDASLSAVINPTGFAGEISECEGCRENNTLRLDGLHFTPMRTEVITPVAEITRDRAGKPSAMPSAPLAFAATAAVSPFPLSVRPYQALIDITSIANRLDCNADCKNGAAFDQISNFDQSTPNSNRQGHIVGINPGVARGLTAPVVFCCDPPRIDVLAVTDANRPLTSVGHEFYHQLGFKHAGYNCPGDPGGFVGWLAESWDPDNQGRLQSFGFDPRNGSGGSSGVFAIAGTQDASGNPKQFFDLMSYCTDNYPETNGWISARNWTRTLNDHVPRELAALHRTPLAARASAAPGGPAAQGRVAAAGPTIAVNALKVGSAAPITHIKRGLKGSVPVPAGKRNATIQLLDRNGDVVAKTATVAAHGHVDHGPDVVSVGATLRDPGTAVRAEIRVGGKSLARVARPRRAPKVRLLRPTRKTKVGSTGTMLVRWSVRAGHAKTAEIDFAADGRHFRPVVLGITGQSYRVPVQLLAKGRKARYRVRVSDGWNEAKAISPRFAVIGPPPVAVVTNLTGTPRMSTDGTLQLEAHGYGDQGRRLPGTALSWYHQGRLLGHGEVIRLSGLPAGRQRVRLVARTTDGRHSSRPVQIEVVGRLR